MSGFQILKDKVYKVQCSAVAEADTLIIEPENQVLKGGLYKNQRTGEIIRIVACEYFSYTQWGDRDENGKPMVLEILGAVYWRVIRGSQCSKAQTMKFGDELRFIG